MRGRSQQMLRVLHNLATGGPEHAPAAGERDVQKRARGFSDRRVGRQGTGGQLQPHTSRRPATSSASGLSKAIDARPGEGALLLPSRAFPRAASIGIFSHLEANHARAIAKTALTLHDEKVERSSSSTTNSIRHCSRWSSSSCCRFHAPAGRRYYGRRTQATSAANPCRSRRRIDEGSAIDYSYDPIRYDLADSCRYVERRFHALLESRPPTRRADDRDGARRELARCARASFT